MQTGRSLAQELGASEEACGGVLITSFVVPAAATRADGCELWSVLRIFTDTDICICICICIFSRDRGKRVGETADASFLKRRPGRGRRRLDEAGATVG